MAGKSHSPEYRRFQAGLVAARKNKGLSQAALAKLLGKPPSFVGKYEIGERRLDLIETLVILKVLDQNLASFLEEWLATLPRTL